MKFIYVALSSLLLLSPLSTWTQEKKGEGKQAKAYKDVGPEQFDKLRANKEAVVLDVRRPSEFAQGHIAGATNIDWYASDFEQRIAALDKSKTYLVHCAGGVRSSKAAEKLTNLKFTNVVNLEGGFKAWQAAGKPVKKSSD